MRHTLHIDEEQIKAILAEVGERLRIMFWLEGRQKVPSYSAIDRSSGRSRPSGRVENVTIDCGFGKRRLAPPAVAKAISLNFTTHITDLVKLASAKRPRKVPR